MSVKNARNVVKQVRKLQEIMKGTVNPAAEAFSPVLCDVGQLVREAAAFLQPLSPRVRVRSRVAADIPKTLADPDQIQQMIVNLYDNSAEAFAKTPAGEGSVDIDVLWNPEQSSIMIIYADDGPGIPADVADRVFEPEFTTKENAEGLGLVECEIVAENHGGEIVLKPGQRKGVLFSIRIPVTEPPAV
jgi:signal transduction histidine kinase